MALFVRSHSFCALSHSSCARNPEFLRHPADAPLLGVKSTVSTEPSAWIGAPSYEFLTTKTGNTKCPDVRASRRVLRHDRTGARSREPGHLPPSRVVRRRHRPITDSDCQNSLGFLAGWRRNSGTIRSLSMGFDPRSRLGSAHQLWDLTHRRTGRGFSTGCAHVVHRVSGHQIMPASIGADGLSLCRVQWPRQGVNLDPAP